MSSNFKVAGALQAQQDFLEKWGMVPPSPGQLGAGLGAAGGAGLGYTAADMLMPNSGLGKAIGAGVGALGGGVLGHEIGDRALYSDVKSDVEAYELGKQHGAEQMLQGLLAQAPGQGQ